MKNFLPRSTKEYLRLNKYQNKLIFEYKAIIGDYEASKTLSSKWIEDFNKLEKDYKRLISLLSIKQLSQAPIDKEQELIHGYDPEFEKEAYYQNEQSFKILPSQIEELEHLEDNIVNYLFNTYMEIYNEKKKALLALVNFAPAVQNAIVKISNYWKYFESERNEIESISSDIDKLTIWYENFRTAYDKFEAELYFRRDYEISHNEEIKVFSEKLNQEYSTEFARRINFNEENAKYLPENLKILLDDPPIRYIVYPQMLNFSGFGSKKSQERNIFIQELETKEVTKSSNSRLETSESLNKSNS